MNPNYERYPLNETMSAEPHADIRESQIAKELKRIEELDQCIVDYIDKLRQALCLYLLPNTVPEAEVPFDEALALGTQSTLQVALEKISYRRRCISAELEQLISRVNP